MIELKERLEFVEKNILQDKITIMIIGLGSVGGYLLDYLISRDDPSIKIVIVGRNEEKLKTRANISQVAAIIRNQCKSDIQIVSGVDLNNIKDIQKAISEYNPDFLVNSSRAYPGLKYGSISWNSIRAYGIWTPLSIRFTKNIMEAFENANGKAIVINTSYSDAVIPWLKTAGKPYPDFGSGNLNHLIPRIKMAVADILNVNDYWNIDVALSIGHFHDVVISKEGQTEGVDVPLKISYKGEIKDINKTEVFNKCNIAMPTDATRNMMNASSNYAIIDAIINTVRHHREHKFFSPGAFGQLGGYPVVVGYKNDSIDAWIDNSDFSNEEMKQANIASMNLDGIEKIEDGVLYYTDYLIEKVQNKFGVTLPKSVPFLEIENTAQFIIDTIINPTLKK